MARIDRKRLEAAALPVKLTVPTRFDDVDTQGHVNNAAAAVILQEARFTLNQKAGVIEVRGELRPVVAAMNIEFAGEMFYPTPIEVGGGVLEIGRTSVTLGQLARQAGRSCVYAETVLVYRLPSGPADLTPAMRAAYERILIGGRQPRPGP